MKKSMLIRGLVGFAGLSLAASAWAAELTDAEVRKVNAESGKLMLKHGPIKNLDMPPMTMVFTVKDPAMIQQVKVGDQIRFSVVSEGGNYVITEIQKK